MLKPICVPCQRFFRQVKIGFYFTEGMPRELGAPPGNSKPEAWGPYKVWSGDRWRCSGCGAEIISGTGLRPVAEHYQDDFEAVQERLGAGYQVNDC